MSKSKEIVNLLHELCEEDLSEALRVSTGAFVGIFSLYVQDQGGDTSKETTLKIAEEGQRDITLHAVKPIGHLS